MKPLSMKFCAVSPEADALVEFLGLGLGFPCEAKPLTSAADSPQGGIFETECGSSIEVWKDGPEMPAGVMLQVVVEDADALAELARTNGLHPKGPMLTKGEKIYYLLAPGGLAMTFQSKLPDSDAK
jgi:hypothetical protein